MGILEFPVHAGPVPGAIPASEVPGVAEVRQSFTPIPVGGLAVGHADDPAEHAADVHAEAALSRLRRAQVRAADRPAVGGAAGPAVEAAVHRLRRSATNALNGGTAVGAEGGRLDTSTSAAIRGRIGSGARLPAAVQRRMETAFGTSLDHVRVHHDGDAARSSAAVSARAFTTGSDIFFGAGQFAPDEPSGERVLAHEIAHVLDEGAPRGSVQRVHVEMANYKSKHRETNQTFLRDSTIQTNSPHFATAAAAAILLDHDTDSRRVLLALDASVQALLQKEIGLFFPGVDVAGVVKSIKDAGDESPGVLSSFLRNFVQAGAPAAGQLSEITWGKPDDLGRGTSVTAMLRPRGQPRGSDAGGFNPWAAALSRRADKHGTFYVRGHLLNRHLGGPGLDYNMVPLTQRSGFGGNDANAAHSKAFEEYIKHRVELMFENGEQHVDWVEYKVSVTPATSQRASTRLALQKSDAILLMMTTWRDRRLTKAAPVLTGPALVAHFQQPGYWPASQPLPEPVQMEKMYALSLEPGARQGDAAQSNSRGLRKALGDTTVGAELLRDLEVGHFMKWLQLVSADRGGEPGELTWAELQERVIGNKELWKLEEEYVPGGLVVSARWFQYGQESTTGAQTIPILKPDDLYSPYWHDRKSFI